MAARAPSATARATSARAGGAAAAAAAAAPAVAACEPGDGTYKLYYFEGRGRAEAIRWLLQYAKIPFEDIRLSKEDWGKKKGEGFSPTSQMPLLECTDKKSGKTYKVVQSLAILRMVAAMGKLAGKTPCEQVMCDEVSETMADMANAMAAIHFTEDAAKKEELISKMKTETGPRIMGYFEKKLTDNGGKFLVGDSYTYADILVACGIDTLKINKPKEEFEAVAKQFPKLFEMAAAVAETPQIKEWITKRPTTQM